jgi:hypothetical protein
VWKDYFLGPPIILFPTGESKGTIAEDPQAAQA